MRLNKILSKFALVTFKTITRFTIILTYTLPFRRKILGIYCDAVNSEQARIYSEFSHKGQDFRFLSNTSYSEYRVRTALTKEPETVDWISNFTQDDVLYDIGANIGLFSILAAKSRNVSTYSFEPSFYNLVHLAENVRLNNVSDKVCIVPCPLFEKTTVDKFTLSEPMAGSAIANFSTGLDQSGNSIEQGATYLTLGASIDDLIDFCKLPLPTKIKLDVDGIEHLILNGAMHLLKTDSVNSILVEVSDGYLEQKNRIHTIMSNSGFTLQVASIRKRESSSENQIWVK